MLEGHIGAGLALAFGIACLAFGARHVQKTRRLMSSGVRVLAVAVAIADPEEAAFPIVQFADTEGVLHRVELSFGDGSVEVGATLEVVYPIGQPEKASRVSTMGFWFVPIACFLAGAVALVAAARLAPLV